MKRASRCQNILKAFRGLSSSMRRLDRAGCVLIASLLVSCRSIGPDTITRDRFDYSAAMTESWKRQLLLNIVKLRYGDPPIFVDVGQIVAGYQVDHVGGLAGEWYPGSDDDLVQLRGEVRFTDRPTITYTPLTGSRFTASLITPIAPSSLFNVINSGWPADLILRLGASSINGHKSPDRYEDGAVQQGGGEYLRILQLMRRLQANQAVSVRVEVDPAERTETLVTLRDPNLPAELAAAADELRDLLGLDPAADEFRLTYGARATNNREIALHTRSLLSVMAMFAEQVDVPEADIADGRVAPSRKGVTTGEAAIRIHGGEGASDDVFVAIEYRGRKFWIDDRDLYTKRAFGLIMLFFTLAETDSRIDQPVLTIPTG